MKFHSKAASAAIAAVILAAAANANADMLVSDSFTYPNGSLVTTPANTPQIGGPWAAHSSAGNGPVQVVNGAVNGQAAIVQNSTVHEDVNVTFTGGYTAGAGSVLYAAFDLDVPSNSVSGAITPEYFAGFLQGTGNYTSRLFIEPPTSAGFKLALANGTSAPTNLSSDLAFDTDYRIVISYDYTNQDGSLWIEPSDINSPSLAGTGTGFSDASTAFAFRQATPTTGPSTETVDNLDVATTFDEALSGVGTAYVPEPASLSVLALGGIALLARRRKH